VQRRLERDSTARDPGGVALSEHAPGALPDVHLRLPSHCVRRAPRASEVAAIQRMLRGSGLASVCEEARCPNRGECWARGHVTFMLLGSVCTRACRFCAVATGRPPAGPDPEEPRQVARAVARLALSHVVLTSVDRDDLSDGGAGQFAAALREIRAACPDVTTEVLTPDFRGDLAAVSTVSAAAPDVYNHNVETVPSVLAEAKRLRPDAVVKSGFMVGLGETYDELVEVLRALRVSGVDSVTIGQYLRPSQHHLPVTRYWDPAEFDALADAARALGFPQVASGPLVRSSFNAAGNFSELRDATHDSVADALGGE